MTIQSEKITPAPISDGQTVGIGSPDADLSLDEMSSILSDTLKDVPLGARVLAIVSDKTRDDNTSTLFPFAAEFLAKQGIARLDVLIAQGTHSAMTDTEKRVKISADKNALPAIFGGIFDHRWRETVELVSIGELSAETVRGLTGGLLNRSIPLRVNRLLTPGEYDFVLVFGATVPHEVAGFAGGAKYFFPGVAGPELTHATHWLGALSGIESVIGRIETPTRDLIEAAAERIPARVISINSVVTRTADDRLRTHALFGGDIRVAFRRAADISGQVHIKRISRQYRRVIALLDEHYDEMWTGGKASYRLGAVIEEGGELIIYAPHLRCFSDTHGELIKKYGYAPLQRVIEMVADSSELQSNLCVAAHLAHVSYAAKKAAPKKFRYRITLATQITEADCRRVNLGFSDYRSFSRDDYDNDVDTLVVENAGRDLYLLA